VHSCQVIVYFLVASASELAQDVEHVAGVHNGEWNAG